MVEVYGAANKPSCDGFTNIGSQQRTFDMLLFRIRKGFHLKGFPKHGRIGRQKREDLPAPRKSLRQSLVNPYPLIIQIPEIVNLISGVPHVWFDAKGKILEGADNPLSPAVNQRADLNPKNLFPTF